MLERVADSIAKQAMWSVAYAVMNMALPGSGEALRIGRRVGDIVDGLRSLEKGHGAQFGIPLLHDQDSGLGISATLRAGGPKGPSLGIDGLFALGDPPITLTPSVQKSVDQADDRPRPGPQIKPVTILSGPAGLVTLPDAPTRLALTRWRVLDPDAVVPQELTGSPVDTPTRPAPTPRPTLVPEAMVPQELTGSPVDALRGHSGDLSSHQTEDAPERQGLCLVIVRPARELAAELGVTRLDGETLSKYGTQLVARRLRDGTPRAAREAMRAARLLRLVIYLDPETITGLCVLLDDQGPVATGVIPAAPPPSQ